LNNLSGTYPIIKSFDVVFRHVTAISTVAAMASMAITTFTAVVAACIAQLL
jgi:hypothetical protein